MTIDLFLELVTATASVVGVLVTLHLENRVGRLEDYLIGTRGVKGAEPAAAHQAGVGGGHHV